MSKEKNQLTKREAEIFSPELLNDFEMAELFAGGTNNGCTYNNGCTVNESQCPCIAIKMFCGFC